MIQRNSTLRTRQLLLGVLFVLGMLKSQELKSQELKSQELKSQEPKSQDTGSNSPLAYLRDELSNYIDKAKKKIPREQKYLILKRAERLVLKPHNVSVDAALQLAHEFRRYLFSDEAENLYERVLKSEKANPVEKTIAYRYLGEMQFVDRRNIDSAITYMKLGLKTVPKNTELHGILLARLGSYYFIRDDIDSMKKTYDEFHQLPKKIRSQMPDTDLKSNLYCARFSKSKDVAERYFARAREIANKNPDSFQPSLVLAVNVESLGRMKWNSPERIKLLVELIENPKNRNLRDILPLAMDVYLAYLLDADKDWKRLDSFYRDISKLLDEQDQLKTKSSELPHHACQVIASYASWFKSRKEDFNRVELRNEFLGWNKRREGVRLYLPKGVTQKEINQIQQAYTRGIRQGLGLEIAKTSSPSKHPDK